MAMLYSRGRYSKQAKHLQLINEMLWKLERRVIRRLAVLLPPRHSKSTLCSLGLPAWYLTRHPDHRFVLATHTSKFATSWGRKVRDLIEEHGDGLGIQVSQASAASDEWELQDQTGGMLAVGIGTGLTGRGADVLAIDDALADAEQALSPTIREKQWDWYCSVAETRLEPNAVEVILATRWHPDDLPSRVIKSWEDSPLPYEVIQLPAIAVENDPIGRKPGEALWPERYDVDWFEEQRRKSLFWFEAMYQCAPVPEGGSIFKVDWFERYQTMEEHHGQRCWKLDRTGDLIFQNDCVVFVVVDPALGKNMRGDDTGILVCAYHQKTNALLILHCIAEIIPVDSVIERVEELAKTWKAQWIGMESNGFQVLLAQSARREVGLPVRELEPQSRSKLSRAVPAIERARNGDLYLPDDDPPAKFLSKLVGQLAEWSGQDGDKDDIVDCVAWAALECHAYTGLPEVYKPKISKPLLFSGRRSQTGRSLFSRR